MPGVTGVDEETGTMYVDQQAMPENVKEWLALKGIQVVEVDAVEEYLNDEIDALHEALEGVGGAATGEGTPLDLLWQGALLYLFGRKAGKDSKGVLGALLKKLVARESNKQKGKK